MHFLLQGIFLTQELNPGLLHCRQSQEDLLKGLNAAAAKSPQSCLTLCDPIDGSPPGSSAPGIFQARTLEWGAISFSRLNAGSEEKEESRGIKYDSLKVSELTL